MSQEKIGPAFPSKIENHGKEDVHGFCGEVIKTNGFSSYPGITIRDYFAAKALPIAWDAFTNGIIASEDGEIGTNQAVAQCAYRFADAMMLERAK